MFKPVDALTFGAYVPVQTDRMSAHGPQSAQPAARESRRARSGLTALAAYAATTSFNKSTNEQLFRVQVRKSRVRCMPAPRQGSSERAKLYKDIRVVERETHSCRSKSLPARATFPMDDAAHSLREVHSASVVELEQDSDP
jgi:hypothetical protein